MILQEELQEEIWGIWQILLDAKGCFQYSNYFYRPKTEEEADYINQSYHIAFIRHALWRSSIIELFKLFSKSDHDQFNFRQFINKLKSGGKYGSLNFDPATIKKWEDALTNNEIRIGKTKVLRNKLYAHTDVSKPDESSINLSLNDTEILIKVVEEIIKDVYSIAFDSTALLDSPFFDANNFGIIKILADAEIKRKEDIRNTILGGKTS